MIQTDLRSSPVVAGTTETQIVKNPRKRGIQGDEKGQVSPPRKSTSRVLFGTPDPVKTRAMFLNFLKKDQARFCKRWNLDPTLDIPTQLGHSTSVYSDEGYSKVGGLVTIGKGQVTKEGVIWTSVIPPDKNCRSTIHVPHPVSPGGRLAIPPSMSSSSQGLKLDELKAASRLYGSTMRERSISPSADMKRLSFSPALRQRFITDYMRVQKNASSTPSPCDERKHP